MSHATVAGTPRARSRSPYVRPIKRLELGDLHGRNVRPRWRETGAGPCRFRSALRPGRLGQPMFDALTDRFEGIFTRLRGRGRLGEAEVDEVLREIRLALLEADVNFKVVRDLVARIRERCRRHRAAPGAEPGPAGHRHRPPGADQPPWAARRSRSPTRPSRPRSCSWPASRARARPPTRPSSPAGSSSRAATRCSSAPTSSARPPSSSSAPSAARSTCPVVSKDDESIGGEGGDPVEVARGSLEEARDARPRRGHRRHRRPPRRSTPS